MSGGRDAGGRDAGGGTGGDAGGGTGGDAGGGTGAGTGRGAGGGAGRGARGARGAAALAEPTPLELEGERPIKLLPAIAIALSAFALFALQLPLLGYPLLVGGLVWAVLLDRRLAQDLALIGLGIAVVSTTSVEAKVDWESFFRIGLVLSAAVAAPFLVDRLVYRRRAIRFPWRSRQKRTPLELAYLVLVPFLGWAILPFYFIRSGAFENWPHITDGSELARFFVGVNAVGTWDELFFICTCFALLRRHFPVWQANLVQATIFVSFLWELGYRSWGPLLTIPFALLQGFLFSRTRSLGYVLIVHLLFDAIVFLAIVHAHNRDWVPIFVY